MPLNWSRQMVAHPESSSAWGFRLFKGSFVFFFSPLSGKSASSERMLGLWHSLLNISGTQAQALSFLLSLGSAATSNSAFNGDYFEPGFSTFQPSTLGSCHLHNVLVKGPICKKTDCCVSFPSSSNTYTLRKHQLGVRLKNQLSHELDLEINNTNNIAECRLTSLRKFGW